jgi:CRP-like cAMP-binding protein
VHAAEAARSARLAPDPASVPSKNAGLAPAASGAWVERSWSVEERSVGGLPLERADALSDLPHAVQAALAARARIDSLGPDEEVSGFGAALVVGGDAAVCATIVDAPAERLHAGAVVPSRGNLGDAGVALRVVAGQSGARVAVWDWPVLEAAIAAHPLVSGELRDRADRLQALAGTTMGPLGDLDETYRNLAVERLVVRLVRAGEVFVEKGMTLGGLAIVGAGELELRDGDAVVGEAGPGDLLFPGAVLQGLAAPATARAGASGALLLVGERALAHELLVTVPPLVEILSAEQ